MSSNIAADFLEDWKQFLLSQLTSLGHNVGSLSDVGEISQKFYNIIRRRIPNTPRKILISKEFLCPGPLLKGLEILKSKASAGDDLNIFLSRTLGNINYNDSLLNDWKVYHFHLGEEIEKDGFAKRTDPLLFARVTYDEIYFINTYNHGQWSEKGIVEILHLNWPSSIKQFKLDGVVGLAHSPDSTDIKKLRRNDVNSIIQFNDNSVYGSLGLGNTSSGESVEASIAATRSISFFRHLQKKLINQLGTDPELLKDYNLQSDTRLSFKLAFEDGFIYAKDEVNCISIELSTPDVAIKHLKVLF